MSWEVIIAGFTLGAAGSLHCVGMCGPLSLALPTYDLSRSTRFAAIFIYQAGRVVTYATLGLLFGFVGRRIYISGYQQSFSIVLGSLVLLLAVLYFVHRHAVHLPFLDRLYSAVRNWIGKLLKSGRSLFTFLLLGMANGLLPCGMVYMALGVTVSLSEITDSVLFMAMFGAGTLPVMLLVGFAGQVINFKWRLLFRKAVPIFITVMGIILILRGMNLGIPFISPELPAATGESLKCTH